MASERAGARPSVSTAPNEPGLGTVRRARTLRRVFLSIIALLVLTGLSTFLGAHTSMATATGNGYRLSVTYPAVSRPGLAIRWIATIEHSGGFSGQVTLATTSGYFNL